MDMNAKKLIVTFPGMGYTNDKPLMYYAIKLAMSKDFDAYCMEYHDLPTKIRGDAAKMKEAAEIAYGQVCERLEGFDFTGFDKIIFVGKSIGTVLAARYAAEHNMHVKQLWYTPVEATFKFGVKRAVAFIGDLMQVKWKPTAKPLKPKLSKLDPTKGLKRLFSLNSVVELIKSLIKIAFIGVICYTYLKQKVFLIYNFYDITLMNAVALIGNTIIDLGIRISAIYIAIAGADFGYQKWKFHKDMMMSKQEVKDEYKNSEGDPQVKGKIKQKMMEASRRRMMQELPKADVVITNPTHYAVAIKYDPAERDAPYVIAKGEGYLAQKIKEIAKENNIQLYENKPVARMLYHNVEIGESVPPELYQAVAEVLAFVINLKKEKSGAGFDMERRMMA